MNRSKKESLTPAQRYEKYLPMAFKFAHRFAARQRLPLGEMIDEAQRALNYICATWDDPKALRRFNKKRGCNETSWMYRALYYELLTESTRGQYKNFHKSVPLDSAWQKTKSKRWVDLLFETLGDDAKVVATTLLFAPEEIATEISTETQEWAKYAVTKYLKIKQGWESVRIDRAWEELKEAI